SRFPLLFSVLSFFIVYLSSKDVYDRRKFIRRNIYKIGFIVVILAFSATLMKQLRSTSRSNNIELIKTYQGTLREASLSRLVAINMTDENVVLLFSELIKYFESHSHQYGAST